MVLCPICSIKVANLRGLASHFRHQAASHPEYLEWQEDQRWNGKVEGEDYVCCLECGHRAATLARHLKASHGITADAYRVKHQDALIRPSKVTEKRREAIQQGRVASDAYDGTKSIVCPSCGREHEVHKLSSVVPCPECKASTANLLEVARWKGKKESKDFIRCLECGYRAENLTSHLQHEHSGYRERHPEALVVALDCPVRDKSALQGLIRPPDFGEKIREAKTLGLTQEDFTPFLEPDGTVDHRRAMPGLGVAWPTLKTYLELWGLRATPKYIEQAADDRRVVLTVEELEKFKLKNGKVSIAAAMSGLGYSNITIKKECRRLGLIWAHGNVSQRRCLDAVSEALDGRHFEEEWKSWRFTNPPTGHRFRFDGYFPDVGLVVEFQGMFHYTFPNPWMVDESYRAEWDKLIERDRIKREMIQSAPDLIYLEVREDEPYTDVSYLQGCLVELGVLAVKPGGLWLGDTLVRVSA